MDVTAARGRNSCIALRLLPSYSPTLRSNLSALSTRLSGQGEKVPAEWAETARNGAKMATWEGICYVGENGVTPLSLQ